MAFKYFDRIKETTLTVGAGTVTLAGAIVGFQAFSSRYTVGDRLHYCIRLPGSVEWEVGLGTFAAGNTLQRNTILASSNADAAVNFPIGTKEVTVTLPANAGLRTATVLFSAADSTERDAIPAAALQLGALCRLRSDNSIWEWSGAAWVSTPSAVSAYADAPQGSVSVAFAAAGNADGTAFTVPASPTGAGRFVLSRVVVRLSTALTGSGSVAVTVGTAAGGTQFITSTAVNNATAVGVIAGLNIATLGASMLATQGYEAVLDPGATVVVRCATTGTVTAGAVKVYVYGYYLP